MPLPIKVVAIVQQRLESTRLPFKALLPLAGKPMTWHLLKRLKKSKLVNEIVLAIPDEKDKGMLIKIATELDVPVFISDGIAPEDLLSRHALAATRHEATIVVRVPGDNPCVQASEVDKIIGLAQNRLFGWKVLFSNLQNLQHNGYPDGIGAEVYHKRFLDWLDQTQQDPILREHPHKWAYEHNAIWTLVAHKSFRRPEVRLDINTQEDYELIRDIYDSLYQKNPDFGILEILEYLDGKKPTAHYDLL